MVTPPRANGVLARIIGDAKGRTNVIGALVAGALLTVSLFETTINTEIFDEWAVQDLLPKLPNKSVVILDNATFHKGIKMKTSLEKAGHTLLYLPPYSPDLNPYFYPQV